MKMCHVKFNIDTPFGRLCYGKLVRQFKYMIRYRWEMQQYIRKSGGDI